MASEPQKVAVVDVEADAPSPSITPAPASVAADAAVEALAPILDAETEVAATAVATEVEATAVPAAVMTEAALEQAQQPLADAEAETPIADAAENVTPEFIVESAPEPVVTRMVEAEQAEVGSNQSMDASSRAQQLRGLFDTARANGDIADAPLAANADSQAATEAEEATRNA
jgi:hypothetical protein